MVTDIARNALGSSTSMNCETRNSTTTPCTVEANPCLYSEASSSLEDKDYALRLMRDQYGQLRVVILQSENGPCPLLAIMNFLLFRGTLCLASSIIDRGYIRNSEILQALFDIIFSLSSPSATESVPINSSRAYSRERTGLPTEKKVVQVLAQLPCLERGLDVNCRFADYQSFEYTQELAIFDLFNIPLVHGWVAAKTTPTRPLFGCLGNPQDYSYNEAVDCAARHSEVLLLMEEISTVLSLETVVLLPSTASMRSSHNDTPNEIDTQVEVPLCQKLSCAKSSKEASAYEGERRPSPECVPFDRPLLSGDTEQLPQIQTSNLEGDKRASLSVLEGADFSGNVSVDSADLLHLRFSRVVGVLQQLGLSPVYANDVALTIATYSLDAGRHNCSETNTLRDDELRGGLKGNSVLNESHRPLKVLLEHLWTVMLTLWELKNFYEHPLDKATDSERATGTDGPVPGACSKTATPFSLGEFLTDGWRVRQFLEDTAEQLTPTGLQQLRQGIPEGSFAVLFRSSHFTVIRRADAHIYQLVTDVGFADTRDVVWERLDDSYGTTTYFNIDLIPSALSLSNSTAKVNVRQHRAKDTNYRNSGVASSGELSVASHRRPPRQRTGKFRRPKNCRIM